MSDKKDWREYKTYSHDEVGEVIGCVEWIERDAFEAEKQRADRLEKELEKVLGAGRDWMKRALDLDDENQKLKEENERSHKYMSERNQKLQQALEHIAYNPEGAAKYAWDKLEALK